MPVSYYYMKLSLVRSLVSKSTRPVLSEAVLQSPRQKYFTFLFLLRTLAEDATSVGLDQCNGTVVTYGSQLAYGVPMRTALLSAALHHLSHLALKWEVTALTTNECCLFKPWFWSSGTFLQLPIWKTTPWDKCDKDTSRLKQNQFADICSLHRIQVGLGRQ